MLIYTEMNNAKSTHLVFCISLVVSLLIFSSLLFMNYFCSFLDPDESFSSQAVVFFFPVNVHTPGQIPHVCILKCLFIDLKFDLRSV